ncbi:8059_t:CDS:2 [Paraglomus brasilianum]|uniref:mannan endo-1,4-beta-mannosidase n=1 Tax=Paraglomus brasilianum TaxID=144538 RepID=A0A9N9APU4_9GLOM|nr:8059_t:CDS:2 [Paraglomus brasilianum]
MSSPSFIRVSSTHFTWKDKPYFLVGANYWQAMNLSMSTGNRTRVLQDLEKLKQMGINNVRIMAGSEGPNEEPFRMKPALMKEPKVYDESVFEGLDWFLDQLSKFDMTATMTLSNFWQWSGGFAQYVSWCDPTHPPIPYPTSSDFTTFELFASRFYSDPSIYPACQSLYQHHVRTVLTRRNTFNGKLYKEDPVIFAWELANEPQIVLGDNGRKIVRTWIEESARVIKDLDANHLVTTGAEGKNGKDWFLEMHECSDIDYASAHVWVENWGYYDSNDPSTENYTRAENFMLNFIDNVSKWSTEELGKPVYLAEYGLARDGWLPVSKYSPSAPTINRNKYYSSLMNKVLSLEKSRSFSGQAFWAYSGIARPVDPPPQWLGDPPHEPAGWYSVYDADEETLQIIRTHSDEVKKLEE